MGGVRAKRGARVVVGTMLGLAVATAGASAKPEATRDIRAFGPEADTYVTAALPRQNFGRRRVLRADGSPRATVYLRFRLKKLKGEITDVTLLLHAEAGARTSYQVRRVREDKWRERRLTFANAPRLSLRYASSRPVRRGAWNAVDVTPFVSDDDDLELSLAITTRSPAGIVFGSRESKRGPRLVLRTDEKDEEDDGPES